MYRAVDPLADQGSNRDNKTDLDATLLNESAAWSSAVNLKRRKVKIIQVKISSRKRRDEERSNQRKIDSEDVKYIP